jgi:hypothetical protein
MILLNQCHLTILFNATILINNNNILTIYIFDKNLHILYKNYINVQKHITFLESNRSHLLVLLSG